MRPVLLIVCLTLSDAALADVRNPADTIAEIVDIIELHECFDFRGRVAFRQLIFYRWSGYHRRFQVIDTVVVTAETMLPQKTGSGFYCCRWSDDSGERIVRGLTCRHSKSSHDPEIGERDFLPTHLREGLKSTGHLQPTAYRSPGGSSANPDRTRTSALPPSPEKLLKF